MAWSAALRQATAPPPRARCCTFRWTLEARLPFAPLDLRLDDVTRIVDVTGGRLELSDLLRLPPDMPRDVRAIGELGDEPLGAGDLLICAVGLDRGRTGDDPEGLGALAHLAPAGPFVLLLARRASPAADGTLAERLAAASCQILDVRPVEHEVVLAVASGRRVDAIAGPAGEAAPDDPLRAALRLVDAAQLKGLRNAATPAPALMADGSHEASARAELRRLDRRLREAQERLSALEESTSYRLGHSLVEAARSPRQSIHALTDVVRIWRGRSALRGRVKPARSRTQVDSLSAWYEAIRISPERILLAHSAGAAGARTRLVLAGVMRDETAAALEPDAFVHRMGPNDALFVLERADPDVVLIETGAFGAGRAWAYAGHPSATERDLRLLEILDAARVMGRPSVLWWTAASPEPVGIDRLASRFDLVLSGAPDREAEVWAPGVQLVRFNDLDLKADRAGPPVYVGAWDPRLVAAARLDFAELLSGGLPCGLEIHVDAHALDAAAEFPQPLRSAVGDRVDDTAAAGLFRSRPVVIAGPATTDARRALEAIACGARVVALAGADLNGCEEAVTTIARGTAARATIEAALQMAPRGPADIRRVSRHIFAARSVPVGLAALAARLGLRMDPLIDRRVAAVAVLTPAASADEAGRLVDDLIGQIHRPHELIALAEPGSALSDDAAGRLAAAGIGLHIVAPSRGGTETWSDAAAHASAPWIAPWSAGRPREPHHLLDLMLAAESSRADAVGYTPGDVSRYVDDLALEQAVVRRETALLISADGRLAAAARRGARLFGIPAVAGSTSS